MYCVKRLFKKGEKNGNKLHEWKDRPHASQISQCLNAVTPADSEQKTGNGLKIQIEDAFYDGAQAVHGLAHAGIPRAR